MQIMYVVGSGWVGTAAKLGTSHTVFWVQDVGGAAHVLTFAALLIVPLVGVAHGRSVSYRPLDVSAPAFTPYSLNIFGKMALGALSGFEYVAIMAGETRSASRTITRSVFLAAAIIALMFILGTDSVIALVPRDRIHLVRAIPVFGAAKLERRPPMWLRIAAGSGFLVSLLYSTLSVFPIIDVASWQTFAAKIVGVIVAANLVGVAIYILSLRSRRAVDLGAQ